MSPKNTRLLLIAGSLVLSVLLFTAPKTGPNKEGEKSKNVANETAVSSANLQVYLNLAMKTVDPSRKQYIDRLTAQKKYDSLASVWDKLKRYDLASHYLEKGAELNNKAENWRAAGNRYYYAIPFCNDKTEVPVLYQCAIRCFRKSLELDPVNNDAKIMLASCYVEGTTDPMKGIGLLKEVEKADSSNLKLQLAFAFFSVKSGQLDKAVVRFKKALAADSTYIETYLHLADAYEQQGNKGGTIEMLEKYASKTGDVTARLEVNKYIKQLKTDL